MRRAVVRVNWRDSRMYVTQLDAESIAGVCLIESVGILLAESKDRVVITRDVLEDDDYRGVLVIPRENIVKIKHLNGGR